MSSWHYSEANSDAKSEKLLLSPKATPTHSFSTTSCFQSQYLLLFCFPFFLALRTWRNIHCSCVCMFMVCLPPWKTKLTWELGFCLFHCLSPFAYSKGAQITAHRLVFLGHVTKEWLLHFFVVGKSQNYRTCENYVEFKLQSVSINNIFLEHSHVYCLWLLLL